MRPVKLSPPIIIHTLGFTLVIILSISLVFYNLFHNSQNQRFSIKSFFRTHTWVRMLTYRYRPGLNCDLPHKPQLPAWLDASQYRSLASILDSKELIVGQVQNNYWQLYQTDSLNQKLIPLIDHIFFRGDQLVTSFAPIKNKFIYPNCDSNSCYIYKLDLLSGSQDKIPAFAGADKLAIPNIRDVFFDESRDLVSYGTSTTNDSPRVVINFNQELIQTINETPSTNRHLEFKGYLPESGLMVYYDVKNNLNYFYQIDGIGLYRRQCPSL